MKAQELIQLGFQNGVDEYNKELYLYIKESDAYFYYNENTGQVSLLSSDSGDTSIVVADVKTIQRIRDLYFCISEKHL